MSDQPVAMITLKDVYDELRTVSAQLAPLVDPEVGVVAKQKDHEGRLRKLEAKLYVFAGLAMAGGAGLGQALDLLPK